MANDLTQTQYADARTKAIQELTTLVTSDDHPTSPPNLTANPFIFPIDDGPGKWRTFSAVLKYLYVVKAYDPLPGKDIDHPNITGLTKPTAGAAPTTWAFPVPIQRGTSGDIIQIDNTVALLQAVDSTPNLGITITARAFDGDPSAISNLINAMQKDSAAVAQLGANFVGKFAPNTTQQLISDVSALVDLAQAPDAVGNLQKILLVEPRTWNAPANTTRWVGYTLSEHKRLASNGTDIAHAYLAVWRFSLSTTGDIAMASPAQGGTATALG